jgi:hypothetical protein
MYYTVKTESGNFQILDEIKDNIQYFRIIDRNGKDCMQIRHMMNESPPELVLSGVSYKPNCTMHMDMESGKPTRDMIRALLVLVMKTVKSVPDIAFLDQSSFDCLAMDGQHVFEINLCLHNFILYGKTWYERYFGAIPFYTEDTPKMAESNQLLEQSYTNISFEQFIKEALRYTSNADWVTVIREKIVKPYNENQSLSWRSFFKTIFNRSDIACNLYEELRPYIQHNFIKFPFNEFHMRIERSIIESYSEFNSLDFVEDGSPTHRKKVINTSNAILHLNGLNYNSNSSNFANFLNTSDYDINNNEESAMKGGKRTTRRRKIYAVKQHGSYQMYMSNSKGRPNKKTRNDRKSSK